MARKKKQQPELEELKKAAKGLLFVSETEAKLEPFLSDVEGEMDKERVLQLSDYEYEEAPPVEEMTLERFFRAVPPGDKKKFDRLAEVLKEQVTGVKVYKVGDEAEKEVLIVGQTKEGKWAGLKTTVVET